MKSETTASVFLELANVYAKKKEFADSVEYQKKAFEIYQELESVDPKILGSIAIKLSEMYEQADKLTEAIDALRKVRVYEDSKQPIG